mgnify:CR=1 FL=1
MTNRERKINDCYHISNFIEILSKYFKLSEPYMEKSTLDFVRNERYMLIKTDIEMNVKFYICRKNSSKIESGYILLLIFFC